MTTKNTLTVYNYHPVSGQFTGASEAEPSPMSPGEFLTPAYATEVAPPETCSDGCVLAWSEISKSWGEIPDRRGEVWYNRNGDAFTVRLAGDPARQGLLPKAPQRAVEPVTPEIPLMRYALVGAGKIIQIIEGYNLVWKVAGNLEMVEAPKSRDDVFIGWLYEEGSFKQPPVVDESEAGEIFPAKAGASR